jgi:hypothetical protein
LGFHLKHGDLTGTSVGVSDLGNERARLGISTDFSWFIGSKRSQMNKQLYRSIQYTNLVDQVKDVYLWPCLVDLQGQKLEIVAVSTACILTI